MRTTTFLATLAGFSFIPSIFGSLDRRQNITVVPTNTTRGGVDPLVDPPFCALRCMGQSTTRFSCSPTDISCLCFTPEFPLLVGECLGRSCAKNDQASAVAFGEAFCETIGVIIVVPIPGADNTTTNAPIAPMASGSVASAIDPAIATRIFFTASISSTATAAPTATSNSSRR